MIIIKHRVNSSEVLANTNPKYGVEIDVRSHGQRLILNHEPMEDGESLVDWIEEYKHKMIIFNIKEEGLEPWIKEIILDYKIQNYFLLDQSFPFLVKFSNVFSHNTAIRFSEYESLETGVLSKRLANWIWVDCFNSFDIDSSALVNLRMLGYKICLVSPELQGRLNFHDEIRALLQKININQVDAVCTKEMNFWEQMELENGNK
jgi:hypothetical protein